MFPLKLNAQEVMGCSMASEVWGKEVNREAERNGTEWWK